MNVGTRALGAPAILLISFISISCATNDAGPPNLGAPKDAGPNDSATADVVEDVVEDQMTLDVDQKDTGQSSKDTIVYAHDRNTLYSIDPQDATYALIPIGQFDCLSDTDQRTMTDIAIDKNGALYGVSTGAVFLDMKIDNNDHVVHCKDGQVNLQTTAGGIVPRFYGLTFAPATPKLGGTETLIGANTLGELYMIDTTTGKLTLVGNLGNVPNDDGWGHDYPSENVGNPWALSGDIVFLSNEGNPVGFATVRDCEDPSQAPKTCSHVDTLIEIDVTKLSPSNPTNVLKKVRGQVLPGGCHDESCGYGSIYGIGAFGEKVYGFTYNWISKDEKTGHIITIDINSGAANLVKDTALSSDGFAGAGVTTVAPIIMPK